jgi:IS4 transposase
LRWQVEIYFKRLKSILNFGELPKRRPGSVVAWLNGKLMVALLLEMIISKAAFPPKENDQPEHLA